jgi:hypothetical protein
MKKARKNIKASTSIVNIAKQITPAKVFLWGGGLLALVIATRQGIKLFSTTDQQQKDNDLDQAIADEQNAGNSLSFPLARYDVFADTLEEATDTSGSDEQAIFDVFSQMQNNADILQLIKAYGTRYNFVFGVPIGKLSLPQIIVSELSESERAELNAILQAKQITINF